MYQRLRAPIAPEEAPGLVASTHKVTHNHPELSQPPGCCDSGTTIQKPSHKKHFRKNACERWWRNRKGSRKPQTDKSLNLSLAEEKKDFLLVNLTTILYVHLSKAVTSESLT